MTLELKSGANPKGVVHYNKPGGGKRKVVLGKATAAELADLHKLGHPHVIEKKAGAK